MRSSIIIRRQRSFFSFMQQTSNAFIQTHSSELKLPPLLTSLTKIQLQRKRPTTWITYQFQLLFLYYSCCVPSFSCSLVRLGGTHYLRSYPCHRSESYYNFARVTEDGRAKSLISTIHTGCRPLHFLSNNNMAPRRTNSSSLDEKKDGTDTNVNIDTPEQRRSSPRKRRISSASTTLPTPSMDESEDGGRPAVNASKGKVTKSKKTKSIKNEDSDKDNSVDESDGQEEQVTKSTKKRSVSKAKASKKIVSTPAMNVAESRKSTSPTKIAAVKPPKSPSHQVITEIDEIPKLWNDEMAQQNNSYTFKIASWNVAGLRAVLNKTPDAFKHFVEKHNIDVLCLQETKIQESHVFDPKLKIGGHILEPYGFDEYYSCSTAKKGYSGTAVFVKRRNTSSTGSKPQKKQKTLENFFTKSKPSNDKLETKSSTATTKMIPPDENSCPVDMKQLVPTKVAYKMGIEKHDEEGRMILVDFPLFTLCNVYVPNAGQNLERLSYRTKEWDIDFVQFMQKLHADRGGTVPVIWTGDLNIAHKNLDVWNDGAKHLAKQAGVTVEERLSFQQQLDTSGYVDAFRKLHPTAAGHYSYWSQRAGNREPNKGLRLDYFICHPTLFVTDDSNDNGSSTSNPDGSNKVLVRDCYMDRDQMGSDHCPVILELEIKS